MNHMHVRAIPALRRAWNAMMRTAEVIEVSPMDDLFGLENEMAVLKMRNAAAGADRQT